MPCKFGTVTEASVEDPCAVFFLCYHKTGNFLLGRLLSVLSEILLQKPTVRGTWRTGSRVAGSAVSPWRAPITRLPVVNADIYQHLPKMMKSTWDLFERPIPPVIVGHGEWIPIVGRGRGEQVFKSARHRGRVLHFVRDPVDLVVSAFKYHSRERFQEYASMGTFHGLACYGCTIQAWHAIFGRCDYSCSYMALLADTARRSAASGLALEYMRSAHMVRNMLANLVGWSNNSLVLQVTVDQMRRNLPKTMACILRFITGMRARNDYLSWAVNEEAVQEMVKEVNRTIDISGGHHGTHRDPKWKHADLHGILLRHPDWGGPLRAARRLLTRIQRRQARLFGCPRVRCSGGACE